METNNVAWREKPKTPGQYSYIARLTGVGVRDCQITAGTASDIIDRALKGGDKAGARTMALAVPGATSLFDPAVPKVRKAKAARVDRPALPVMQRVDTIMVPPAVEAERVQPRLEVPQPGLAGSCDPCEEPPMTLAQALARVRAMQVK